MFTCAPRSYYERYQNISTYAQRLWWCYYSSSDAVVDTAQRLGAWGHFKGSGHVVGYKVSSRTGQFPDVKYVLTIQRGLKPCSTLQVYDEWLMPYYNIRSGVDCFKIWHPSTDEIQKRIIREDDYVKDDILRETLFRVCDGVYYGPTMCV
ncbi:Hypothetical predicted protein [Paramuricea clavata]|uniref:Uncharacterized protein n=1 Tax=Paramuricea clavata TaxID=317549 RepID=A0A6S7IDF9_PARCT|nr:Hypothetical predicted protein [Paramuricea clavata]